MIDGTSDALALLAEIYDGMVAGVRTGHVTATFAGKQMTANELMALGSELRAAVHFSLTDAGRTHVEHLLEG
jgi:hypothetical protein